jgi:hypothetical protein
MLPYRKMTPIGKCPVCTINLWAEHKDGPAPHAMPCMQEGCPHETNAKMIVFPRSLTGSAIATIEG